MAQGPIDILKMGKNLLHTLMYLYRSISNEFPQHSVHFSWECTFGAPPHRSVGFALSVPLAYDSFLLEVHPRLLKFLT